MPVDVRAALALRLAVPALVVGEEVDPIVDVGGYERPVGEPRLLATSVQPDDCWMPALFLRRVDRPREDSALAGETDRDFLVVGSVCRLAEPDGRIRARRIGGIAY